MNNVYESFRGNSNEMSAVISLVNECINLEADDRIGNLRDRLLQLYQHFNKPGAGQLIVEYPDKDNLALCFAFMLRYDWINDSDIREVWAEDGFYCIIRHLQSQSGGREGQAVAMLYLFILLCVGRNSLIPKIQDILDRGLQLGNPVFHIDDYRIGAQNVIDQMALMATSGTRDFGPQGAQVVGAIAKRFDGLQFFTDTIRRRDLMKYEPMDVFRKMTFISDVIESILIDM